jgi:hypothetical protein
MSGWSLTAAQRAWLLETMFKESPPEQSLPLKSLIQAGESSTVLVVYDRGTKGLCGPTRADENPSGRAMNFVNLLRNVGQPPAAFRGGGTYGFGKTALFLASRSRTIIAHSQICTPRGFEQRFMGAGLGSQFSKAKRYTGRHWWGRRQGQIVEPLTGREAASAAKALGLPPFEAEETGTTICIVLPDFEGRSPEDAMRHIGQAILRSFWPKMVDGARHGSSIAFELSWDGTRIPMPRPQQIPPIGAYVKAFANLQAHLANKPLPHPGGRLQEIETQRPTRLAGTLSMIKFPAEPRLALTEEDDKEGPFSLKSHHVALLRGPHFVVEYLEGPTMPYDLAEYAGVFVSSEESEEAFARSEPPTHDAWVSNMLDDKNDKRLVNASLKRIKEAMQLFAGATAPGRVASQAIPLGAFSDYLGGLVPGEKGTGARGSQHPEISRGEDRNSGSDRGATSSARVSTGATLKVVRTGNLDADGGTKVPVFVVEFELEPRERKCAVQISATVNVVLEDGSSESEPPLGADDPRILFWSDNSGKVSSTEKMITIGARDRGPWTLAVAMPLDAAIAVDFSLENAE